MYRLDVDLADILLLGFDSGGINKYAVISNRSVSAIDPSGLEISYHCDPEFEQYAKRMIDKIRKRSPIARKIIDPYLPPASKGGKAIRIIQDPKPGHESGMPGHPGNIISQPIPPTIFLPPRGAKLPGFPIGGGKFAPHDPLRGFGHEVGHIAYPNPQGENPTPGGDPDYEICIIRRYENPIPRQLNPKAPARTGWNGTD